MITVTSLKHPATEWNTVAAMYRAMEQSKATMNGLGWNSVLNKKGKTMFWVRHSRNTKDDRFGFRFFTIDNKDITDVVLKALRNN